MSIRKILSVLIISAEVMALAACSSDPAAVTGSPKPAEPPSSSPSPSATVVHEKGFIWSADDGFTVIPTPSYAESMTLTGINNLGQAIGYLTLHDGQGDDRAFIWSAKDGLQLLGSLVGADGISWALSIDDNGEVRGLSEGPSTREGGMGPSISDAFVWTASGGIKPATSAVSDGKKLILPSGTNCMNVVRTTTAGFAVGYAGSGESGLFCEPKYAVMWQVDGTPVVMSEDYPCDARSCDVLVSDINNHGEVVGSYTGRYGFFFNGFRWTRSGGFVQAPIVDGYPSVINDNGDAAGTAYIGDVSKPLVWMASGEIATIELPAGTTFDGAAGINNRGQVIGQFR